MIGIVEQLKDHVATISLAWWSGMTARRVVEEQCGGKHSSRREAEQTVKVKLYHFDFDPFTTQTSPFSNCGFFSTYFVLLQQPHNTTSHSHLYTGGID